MAIENMQRLVLAGFNPLPIAVQSKSEILASWESRLVKMLKSRLLMRRADQRDTPMNGDIPSNEALPVSNAKEDELYQTLKLFFAARRREAWPEKPDPPRNEAEKGVWLDVLKKLNVTDKQKEALATWLAQKPQPLRKIRKSLGMQANESFKKITEPLHKSEII
jgi:hypothetical protein